MKEKPKMFLADVKKAYFAALDKLPERERLLAKKEQDLEHLISENIFLKQELEETIELLTLHMED